ncbi:unnamed protein product, partial [Rotaria sp. Silwood2]
MQAVVGGQT